MPYYSGTAPGVVNFRGVIDASGNPNYPAATSGDMWIISVAGKIGGAAGTTVEVGDQVIAITTNAGGTEAQVGLDFAIIQANVPHAVSGPSSSTARAIAVYTDTSGALLSNTAAFVDTNGNVYAPNVAPGLVSIATAAATTTLTVASKGTQVFTGVTTQTVVLPVVTTLPQLGFQFLIVNNSSGALTVNSSGANLVTTIAAGNSVLVTCILLTGTAAASWNVITLTLASTVALITQTITNGDTTHAPSGDAVFDALALKVGGNAANNLGYLNIPPNPQSVDYTTVLADSGKCVLHPVTDDNPRTFTIDKNATVAYPLGTCIQFINRINTLTIAIDTDTLIWSEDGSVGPRTLSANGTCVVEKTEATVWLINGSGLT